VEPKLKDEFASDNQDMRRLVKRAEKGAGDFEDPADISVLNNISRLEFLKADSPHGVSNAILEVDKLEGLVRRQAATIRELEGKLKKIHELSSGWTDRE
jgi:hypothetical protein